MAGEIRAHRKKVGPPHFIYKPKGWERDLDLMNTSSMISELAPVVLYLRHHVRPGDILILEEPEAHLHPKMQARLMREIARMVQAGVQILLTTHSEWVVSELSNIVADGETEQGGEDAPSLKKEDVGVWKFAAGDRSGGSTITEVPWDVDEAGFDSGFDLVEASQYNAWVKAMDRLDGNAS